ncbi:MAG: FAD-dependent oxidoreductase, partial [Bacteroidota bacterium]
RLVIGASSQERDDLVLTAGGVFRLLEGAVEVLPAVEEMELVETWVGQRPASRDHAPLIGLAGRNVVLATGHYRHGILLAPVTAEAVARLVGGETPDWLAPFAPARFDTHA